MEACENEVSKKIFGTEKFQLCGEIKDVLDNEECCGVKPSPIAVRIFKQR
jgi:hypothetical protein